MNVTDAPVPVYGFALVAARVLGLVAAAPLFSSRLLPWRLKLGVVVVLALAVASSPAVNGGIVERSGELALRVADPMGAVILFGTELLAGIGIAAGAFIVLAAAHAAAQMITQQSGLCAAAIADPQGEGEETPLPFFQTSLTVLLFLAADLHHVLIRALATSYEAVPIGGVDAGALPTAFAEIALGVGPLLFASALTLALPVFLALGLVSLAQGLLGRVLPEAELFTLGLPLRAFVAIAVVVIAMPAMSDYLRILLEGATADGVAVLHGLGA